MKDKIMYIALFVLLLVLGIVLWWAIVISNEVAVLKIGNEKTQKAANDYLAKLKINETKRNELVQEVVNWQSTNMQLNKELQLLAVEDSKKASKIKKQRKEINQYIYEINQINADFSDSTITAIDSLLPK